MKNISTTIKIILLVTLLMLLTLVSCKKNGINSESDPLVVQLYPTPVSIDNDSDGAIDLTVTGGKKPYTFLWSNGETTEDLSNLSVGVYSVTITDEKGQTKTESTEVEKIVPLNFSLNKTDVTSYGASDGSIDLTITSGSSPFQYLWSNGDTTEDISNLSSDWYSVRVKDYYNQTIIDSVFISEPPLTLYDSVQVNNDLFIIEEPNMGGVNISVYSKNQGVLIIDSGYQQNVERLVQNFQALNTTNVTHIINTHHHEDHAGGNSLVNSGTVLGHLNGKWEYQSINPDADFIGYSVKDSINIFDENIIFYPTEQNGHSITDLIIYFANSKIVFMGDLYLSESFPSVSALRGASIQNALSHLEFVKNTFPDANWVVPGHGKVSTINELSSYIDMVNETITIIREAMALGKDLSTIKSENLLSDYSIWGTALPGLSTNFWIEAIYYSYL